MVWGEPLNGEDIYYLAVGPGRPQNMLCVFLRSKLMIMKASSGRQESNTIVTRSIFFSKPIY